LGFLRFKPDKGLSVPTIVPTSRQVYSMFSLNLKTSFGNFNKQVNYKF